MGRAIVEATVVVVDVDVVVDVVVDVDVGCETGTADDEVVRVEATPVDDALVRVREEIPVRACSGVVTDGCAPFHVSTTVHRARLVPAAPMCRDVQPWSASLVTPLRSTKADAPPSPAVPAMSSKVAEWVLCRSHACSRDAHVAMPVP